VGGVSLDCDRLTMVLLRFRIVSLRILHDILINPLHAEFPSITARLHKPVF